MLDKQLWKEMQGHLGLLLGSSLCGVLCAVAILGQAFVLAGLINQVFLHHGTLDALLPQLGWLLFWVTARLALQIGQEWLSLSLGSKVQQRLRQALLDKIQRLGPVAMHQAQRGQVLYLLNEGVASLESYFSKYLPQLLQTAIIPVLFLWFVLPRDLMSGLILLVTAPLVPFFMVLIGKWTNRVNARQWVIINQLSGFLHDVMAGLTTLKLLNRSAHQAQKIQQVGDQYARSTLAVLRWAFLSSLALELCTTISIALVSVGLGLRLVEGTLAFDTAFFILLLAPEFYQPLRSLGTHFHTSLNTREASQAIYAFLEQPDWVTAVTVQPTQPHAIAVEDVTAGYPDSSQPVLQGLSLQVQPGETVAIIGPSGSGKSTLLHAIQGFLPLQQGSITLQQQPAVIQQKPYIFAGTILDNLRFGQEQLTEAEIAAVCRKTGLQQLLEQLPQGLHTRVGQGGAGLSGGQRQMIAMVRAICQQKSVVLLDEATANLDLATERQLQDSLQVLLNGRTVLLVAHRLTTLQRADRIVVLEEGRIVQSGTPQQLQQEPGFYRDLLAQGVTAHEGA